MRPHNSDVSEFMHQLVKGETTFGGCASRVFWTRALDRSHPDNTPPTRVMATKQQRGSSFLADSTSTAPPDLRTATDSSISDNDSSRPALITSSIGSSFRLFSELAKSYTKGAHCLYQPRGRRVGAAKAEVPEAPAGGAAEAKEVVRGRKG